MEKKDYNYAITDAPPLSVIQQNEHKKPIESLKIEEIHVQDKFPKPISPLNVELINKFKDEHEYVEEVI